MYPKPSPACRSLFLSLIACCITARAAGDEPRVQVVVGHLLPSEGGPQGAQSPLDSPFGIDFDSGGEMVIVELAGGRVFRRTAAGELLRIAGDGSTGRAGDGKPAFQATFNGMHNVAVTPTGDIYIADSWNHSIRRIDKPSGTIQTVAGTGAAGFRGDGGAATQAAFDYIMCVALNSSSDRLYIADLNNRRVRMLDLTTGIVQTVAGNGKKGVPLDGALALDGPLVDPRAVAVDSLGQVYVLEREGHALRRVTPDGRIHTVAGTGQKGYQDGPARQAQFASPKHLCVDDADNVYIADDENGAIRKYDPKSQTITTVVGHGRGTPAVELLHPHGVCFEKGSLYVVDTGNHRILKVALP